MFTLHKRRARSHTFPVLVMDDVSAGQRQTNCHQRLHLRHAHITSDRREAHASRVRPVPCSALHLSLEQDLGARSESGGPAQIGDPELDGSLLDAMMPEHQRPSAALHSAWRLRLRIGRPCSRGEQVASVRSDRQGQWRTARQLLRGHVSRALCLLDRVRRSWCGAGVLASRARCQRTSGY